MKTVKVSIKDENTLVLQEDASKGDLIDLKSLHDLDIDKNTIADVVKSIKLDKFNEELQKKVKEETESIDLRWEIKVKDIIREKDLEKTKLEDQIKSSSQEQELAII